MFHIEFMLQRMYQSNDAIIGIFFLIGVAIVLIPAIFFCITLQNTLNKVSGLNRTMQPGQVWLLFIPLFNIVWQFIVISRMASSLHNEFVSRNIPEDPEPGKSIGIAFCVLGLVSVIPIIGILTSIAGFVCFIIYWVKIAGYSSKLNQPLEYYAQNYR